MSDDPLFFDPIARRLAKQLQREEDDRMLDAGEITAEELRLKNFMFASLDIVGSTIERPKR